MKKTGTKTSRVIIVIVTAVLALLLLVPLALTFYAFPLPGDDYANTLTTIEAWKQDGRVLTVIAAGFRHAGDIYLRLQGNFTGVLVMALNPLLISVSAYQISLLVINMVFMLSVLWLFFRLIYKRWRVNRYIVVFLAVLVLFISYNRLMSFVEFGYNFVSASYYTLPFSMALLYLAMLLRMNDTAKKQSFSFIVLLFLSAFLGLNNFPLAMMLFAGLGLVALITIIKKHRLWKRLLTLFVVFSAFFALSMFAPGNSGRTNVEWAENSSIFTAIFASFVMSAKLTLIALVSTPLLGVLLLLTPMLAKQTKAQNGKFTNPLLFGVLTFMVFMVQYIPVLYASGYDYHGRIENIKWVSCLILIVVNYINLVGFLAKKQPLKNPKRVGALTAGFGTALVLFSLWAYYLAPAKIDDALFVHRMHYETIYRQYYARQLDTYREEQVARFAVLNDDSIKDVEFNPLSYDNVICGMEALHEDKDENRNRLVAKHYDKNYILILPKE